jgi:hypothetical protein
LLALDDQRSVGRLAALDSAPNPAAPILLAEVDGELHAAVSLVDSNWIADPFRPGRAARRVAPRTRRGTSRSLTVRATNDPPRS